jgi:hypothetical protein
MLLAAGKSVVNVQITDVGNRLELQFPYNAALLAEIKMMKGAKWHGFETPPRKI